VNKVVHEKGNMSPRSVLQVTIVKKYIIY